MMDLIHELWYLKRDIVSDDYDRALFRLAQVVPMTVHEYSSGENCWTWTIPEKWTCHEAYIETMDGERILDVANHPLHVMSYSLPFDGVVSREELLLHLHTHAHWQEAIPFVFKYYQRDWGLCSSQIFKDSLKESYYRVVIRTSFEKGTLKVGEVICKGESEKSIVLAAHLCHPAMVSDDLTGVVVGVDVMRSLLQRPKPYYTVRFLILPETIGSVAYLSHHEHLIPSMVGGLFLESLGLDSPHVLQTSFVGEILKTNPQPDRCFISAIKGLDSEATVRPYRTVVKNDEVQFNAPGVRVPMLSLSRAWLDQPPSGPFFYGYHSSLDTPELASQQRLENSRDLVLGLLDAWEKNYYVINRFKGEVFCSRYGIWIDYRTNPEGWSLLFRVMEYCDGEHTVADIAEILEVSFAAVWGIVSELAKHELVAFSRVPQPTDPHHYPNVES